VLQFNLECVIIDLLNLFFNQNISLLQRGVTVKSKNTISYRKLWHILIDKGMKKKDLAEAANLTHYQMTKLANNKDITTDILGRICNVLDCNADDVIEFIKE